MPQLQRDETGYWRVVDADDNTPESFLGALDRQLNALEPLFIRAKAVSEFEFVFCLLRFRGAEDAGWQPYETSLRAIPAISNLARDADVEASKHLAMWLYGHAMEASEPYELLANLLNVIGGQRYNSLSNFPPRGNRTPSPGEKISQLHETAERHGFPEAFPPLVETWDRHFRNAAFHADYSVTRDELRILNPNRRYTWVQFDALVNGAIGYHTAFSSIYKHHVQSYSEAVTIPVHPGWSPDPTERAVTIVRQDYGLVGIKDAWTRDQVRLEGRIPFRIGTFTRADLALLDADPTLALLPSFDDQREAEPPSEV